MTRKSTLLGLAILSGLFGIAEADIAELATGCSDCHGDNGLSRWSDVPIIAGMSSFVLSDALYIYRDEERPCNESEYRQGDTSRAATDMCQVAAKLSDDDIDGLAEYFAGLEFVAIKQDFDANLAEQGKIIHNRHCENCHADNGRDPEEDAGVLAGQWTEYLLKQFEHFQDGSRDQPEKMEKKIRALTEQDILALLNFYASLQ